jgi:hypothetical protein
MAKRKSGQRYKNGRLKGPTTRLDRIARDYGNDFVQKRRAMFDAMSIRGGKAADQVFDGIGQLWALDFLDGHHLDPDVLRDTARRYAELYWTRNGATAPKTGKAERVGFSLPSLEDNGGDLLFERWLDYLPDYERRVLEHVMIDCWFTDREAPFVTRLVSTELLSRGKLPEFVELSTAHDRDLLDALMRALFVLVDGALPARFERRAA